MAFTLPAPARLLFVLVAVSATFIAAPRSVHAAPAVAPAATPAIAAACQQQVADAQATIDDVIPISGIGQLQGCVADTSGIDRVLVGWTRTGTDDHARLCTDPTVVDGVWTCTWDTTDLPRGRYDVRLVAIDAAGNQGEFTRKYDVRDPAPAPSSPTPPSTGGGNAPRGGAESTDQPAPGDAGAADDATPAPDASAPDATAPDTTAPEAGDTEPEAGAPVPAAEFSPTQRLVADRITLCEQGGDAATPTDSDDIVTQLDQANAVAACLAPATDAAGAVAIGLDADIPVPPTVRVTVATEQLLRDLRGVLPEFVGGVPVVLHLATAAELAELEAAASDAAAEPTAP